MALCSRIKGVSGSLKVKERLGQGGILLESPYWSGKCGLEVSNAIVEKSLHRQLSIFLLNIFLYIYISNYHRIKLLHDIKRVTCSS